MSDAILSSRLLTQAGLRHGFTTRLGGVSVGPWASFNLSTLVDDDPDAVAENRCMWSRETGLAWEAVVGLNQVHGAEVLLVDRPPEKLPPKSERRFDASVTDRPDVVLAVRTADCVPILLASDEPPAVAAVHAGWRGTLDGIVAQAVESLDEHFGCRPDGLLAAIGPCIGSEAFEVGPEVYDPFIERFGQEVARRREGRLTVDLVAANRDWLGRAGLRPERIESLDLCTHARSDLFYSHRRDRGRTGRQMAFVTLAC